MTFHLQFPSINSWNIIRAPICLAPPKLKAKWRTKVIYIFIQRTIILERKNIHIFKQILMLKLCYSYSKQQQNSYKLWRKIYMKATCSWYNFMSTWRNFVHRLAYFSLPHCIPVSESATRNLSKAKRWGVLFLSPTGLQQEYNNLWGWNPFLDLICFCNCWIV